MKEDHLLKPPQGRILAVLFMAGNEREDDPPRLPTPIRTSRVSARKNMQAIQEIRRTEKNGCRMAPETPQKSVKIEVLLR